ALVLIAFAQVLQQCP
nr:RecName: Full=Venom prothrombin activator; Short=vPA [Bothrops atrox]